MTNVAQFPSPRIVRSVPEPLGLYVRMGRNDHTEFLNLLATGDAACFGTVLDPTYLKRHEELRQQVLAHKLDAILDPRTQAAATPGGFTEALGKLPWGLGRQHVADDFRDGGGRRIVASLEDFVLEHGLTQVVAPTHLLRSAEDDWLEIDVDTTEKLRDYLDKKSGAKIPIIYSLALTGAMLRDADQRHEVINALRGLPVSAVWLKVDGFGSDASPTAVRNYIEVAAEFHELGIPIVADHVGGLVGLALVSFGATSGLAHGVTCGERFSSSNWRKPQDGDGFSMQPRVYVPQLDLLLKRAEAQQLLEHSPRARGLFGCNDTRCCPRGIQDMLQRPSHHFLCQRIKEMSALGQVPEKMRAQTFLEQHLRPASDRAVTASNMRWQDDALAKKTREKRKRLDALRTTLGHQAIKAPRSFAYLPKTRVARDVQQRDAR